MAYAVSATCFIFAAPTPGWSVSPEVTYHRHPSNAHMHTRFEALPRNRVEPSEVTR